MLDPTTLSIVAATFLIAGSVKGIIGLGLPTVSLALLTVAMGLPEAMNLLLIPSFVTNVWQAFVGGHTKEVIKRIWPFLLAATVTIWFGANALTRVDLSLLSALLGLLLIAYAALNLSGFKLTIKEHREGWAGPAIGAINGILTGMTGSFVVPGVMFLQALGLSRDALIQAMGMLFSLSTLGLGIALGSNDLLDTDLGLLSGAALIPAILGMVIGQKVRQRLSDQLFRRIFFISILLLGAYIIFGAIP